MCKAVSEDKGMFVNTGFECVGFFSGEFGQVKLVWKKCQGLLWTEQSCLDARPPM